MLKTVIEDCNFRIKTVLTVCLSKTEIKLLIDLYFDFSDSKCTREGARVDRP